MTLAREDGQERAISCLEQLRNSALGEQLSRHDLLNRLDSLEILILEDYDRQRDLLKAAESRLANHEMKVLKRERRQTPNYSLPRDVRQYSPPSSHHKQSDRSEQDVDPEEESEGDDSFARLSTMLERSISMGQEALVSSQFPSLGPVLDDSEAGTGTHPSSSLGIRHRTFPSAVEVGECRQERGWSTMPTRRTREAPRVQETEDVDAIHGAEEATSDRTRMAEDDPPSYKAQADPPVRPATVSLIDDGVMALESLIDQLSSSTLAGRDESGLTSNRVLVFGSLMVLFLSLIISWHGELGVSCHCICPSTTTS